MGVAMGAATVSMIRVLRRHVATVGGMGVMGYLGSGEVHVEVATGWAAWA